MSLSAYLRAELERFARELTPAELVERVSALEPQTLEEAPAAAVRAEREHG
jgi:hypothetical protein